MRAGKQPPAGVITLSDAEIVDEADAPVVVDEHPVPAVLSGAGDDKERLNLESLKSVIENYLSYYASGEGHTARAKRYDLLYFLEYLNNNSRKGIERVRVSDWTLQRTKDFVDDRLSLGEAPATVGRRLATIKHFGRTLAERFPGYINPAREVKGPVLQPTKPKGLGAEEIALLRRVAADIVERKKSSFLSLRNQCVLELLLATGLRADEVRLLVMAQVSDDADWLKNVKTKGQKFRNVYLDTQVRQMLTDYIVAREKHLNKKFPEYSKMTAQERARFPVFVGFHSARVENPTSFGLSPKTVWRTVSDFGKRASALSEDKMTNLHPHLLRHTFAHGLLDSSKDVRLVAQALGHSDVRTTMRYTERTEEEIAKAIEKKISSD